MNTTMTTQEQQQSNISCSRNSMVNTLFFSSPDSSNIARKQNYYVKTDDRTFLGSTSLHAVQSLRLHKKWKWEISFRRAGLQIISYCWKINFWKYCGRSNREKNHLQQSNVRACHVMSEQWLNLGRINTNRCIFDWRFPKNESCVIHRATGAAS